MVHTRKIDKCNFDKSIVGFIGKALTGKRLEGKTLTNHWLFVKFVKVFPHQTFALYGNSLISQIYVSTSLKMKENMFYVALYSG